MMVRIKLYVYLIAVALTTASIVCIPISVQASITLFAQALLLFTLIGWRETIYAMMQGVLASSDDPTANLQQGEE